MDDTFLGFNQKVEVLKIARSLSNILYVGVLNVVGVHVYVFPIGLFSGEE